MRTSGCVFLVDDDDALRKATSRLLASSGFEVLAFASAEEFLDGFDADRSGCLLLDLRMPGKSGLELQEALRQVGSCLPIVFLTGHADVPTSVFAMKQGAIDVLEKPVDEQVLVAALHRAIERDFVLRQQQAELLEMQQRFDRLTPRERDVLRELIVGQRNKQAARVLGIAERTVKLHRAQVLKKMSASTLADLGRIAERLGLGDLRRESLRPGESKN